jgi:hypothetical protein
VAAALLLLAAAGCGPRTLYPVRGRLVFPDGSPVTGLAGAAIEFEPVAGEPKVGARGEIDGEGRFVMTSERPGDGALLGKHRVLIERVFLDPERMAPRVLAEKYERFDTSGLEVTVEPKTNEVRLTVEPAGRG